MKGFPNQVSDLVTLTKALGVVSALLATGKNARSDDVFGEALLRAGVLRTGHRPIPIDTYLTQQRTLTTSNQSFRTRARGLRELFRLLGLVQERPADVSFTEAGERVLRLPDEKLTQESRDLWRVIINRVTHDGGDGESSHPYQVLLRLVARRPGITRAKCALALEAKNDTEDELQRMAQLATLDEDEIRRRIGVSKANWDNAKKILPRFAEQLGDVRKVGHEFFPTGAPGAEAPAQRVAGAARGMLARRPRSSRTVTPATIAQSHNIDTWDEAEELTAPTVDPATYRRRQRQLRDRLQRHNNIVRQLAHALEQENAALSADPYDCLAVFAKVALLIEVKSLDRTEPDEVARVRDALSQLLYYESFAAESRVGHRRLTKVACFESKISDGHIRWLCRSDIVTIWVSEDSLEGDADAHRELGGHLGF